MEGYPDKTNPISNGILQNIFFNWKTPFTFGMISQRVVGLRKFQKILVSAFHRFGVKMGQSIWSNFSVADYKSSLENENDLYQIFKSTACSFWFSASPFQVWLKYGNEERPPPEQLPIVLQVLLSQAHRLKALDLLGQFLDLGPWAVNLALSVGIFPYVLRLLQVKFRITRTYSLWALNSIWQVETRLIRT